MKKLIPHRWYEIDSDDNMTTWVQWLGRRWLIRPCHNWINDWENAC